MECVRSYVSDDSDREEDEKVLSRCAYCQQIEFNKAGETTLCTVCQKIYSSIPDNDTRFEVLKRAFQKYNHYLADGWNIKIRLSRPLTASDIASGEIAVDYGTGKKGRNILLRDISLIDLDDKQKKRERNKVRRYSTLDSEDSNPTKRSKVKRTVAFSPSSSSSSLSPPSLSSSLPLPLPLPPASSSSSSSSSSSPPPLREDMINLHVGQEILVPWTGYLDRPDGSCEHVRNHLFRAEIVYNLEDEIKIKYLKEPGWDEDAVDSWGIDSIKKKSPKYVSICRQLSKCPSKKCLRYEDEISADQLNAQVRNLLFENLRKFKETKSTWPTVRAHFFWGAAILVRFPTI